MLTTTSLGSLGQGRPTELPSQLASATDQGNDVQEARELKQVYSQFVGETFFGQMLKSMRATVGEPAYFHGGMAEEQFEARLDQQLAQDMATQGGSFADGLFRQQFAQEAALLDAADQTDAASSTATNRLSALDGLRRR